MGTAHAVESATTKQLLDQHGALHFEVRRDLVENGGKGTNPKCAVLGNSDVMLAVFLRSEAEVAPSLSRDLVTQRLQGLREREP